MCMIPLDSYQEIEEHEILLASSHQETAEVSDTPLPDISGDGEDGDSEEEDNPLPQVTKPLSWADRTRRNWQILPPICTNRLPTDSYHYVKGDQRVLGKKKIAARRDRWLNKMAREKEQKEKREQEEVIEKWQKEKRGADWRDMEVEDAVPTFVGTDHMVDEIDPDCPDANDNDVIENSDKPTDTNEKDIPKDSDNDSEMELSDGSDMFGSD